MPKKNPLAKPNSVAAAPANSYAAAVSAVAAARQARLDAINQDAELAAQLRIADADLKAAVRKEDYAGAAKLKESRDTLDCQLKDCRANLRSLGTALSEAVQRASELYFKQHGTGFAEEVSVTRAYVVDPQSGDSSDIVYTDSSRTVSMSVAGKSFDSEAYHLGDWALENGFYIHYVKETVLV